MLRILTLSTLFPDASRPNFGIFVERQTCSLATRDDIEVRVIAPVGIPPWPLSRLGRYRVLADLPKREDWKGIDVHRPRFLNLPGTGGRLHAGAVERAVLPVARAIRADFPFDLICAEFFYPGGPAAVALGRHFGVPVSITARGSDIHYWGKVPGVREQIVAAGKAASGMIAVSEALRDDMIALGMPGERIVANATGVDLERFVPHDRAAAKAAMGISGPLVVSLGALIPLKGHDILIDAVARLPGVNLRIAGQGPEQAKLAAQIERVGLSDRVKLLGGVPHDEIGPLVAAADVMALASEREGLANAWIEALASGTPVVIPDVGGARQVLRGGAAAGRLAERSAQGFADAIAATLADPPDPAAVRAVALPYTWAANSARLHACYSRLVSGTGMEPD
ncbi:glycosyltransferase [Sphingomonas sp. G-3-2-10]|uniref:glycosyltransferase n=1 Tax=Sphingomonas sp. G-3-2-10 TaxID=2728838 RepID=UPI00146CD519|nr:glycosyltransferase [Sphingomonas sp. G-3-2-10]NML06188.1 glycosyltransferase family 4 protein [Sphingomonas sp. G-3-2-10]